VMVAAFNSRAGLSCLMNSSWASLYEFWVWCLCLCYSMVCHFFSFSFLPFLPLFLCHILVIWCESQFRGVVSTCFFSFFLSAPMHIKHRTLVNIQLLYKFCRVGFSMPFFLQDFKRSLQPTQTQVLRKS
jgi:hypothetical protein